ncbi:MAG: GlsB/YeaQ/YmgE family stress response membrane protein [Actinomycetota bacterium]|nr:GlsB/YeaQ/YmgE family stress response membrane protein [Actinomycetota bacterium]
MLLLIVSILIFGLIVGGLGRLIVPGHNPMGFFATALVGIGGALLGGVIARLLWPDPAVHRLGVFVCEVLGAAVIVALVSGTRRRRVYY